MDDFDLSSYSLQYSLLKLLHGDNREQLKHLADNSIDSIVCDPPYELGFMGKRWDSTGIAYDRTVWTECLRVLKPGGHLIAFGGTRTYHRMTVAIEDAGFEIRDCIMWLYGSGFPKSHDVSKALDKQAGAEREVVERKENYRNFSSTTAGASNNGSQGGYNYQADFEITAPATDLAKQWHGWGTALKPAVEPAVLARKPLIGTVADNVTTWGVGGINVDGCRVGDEILPEQKAGQAQLGTFIRHDMTTPERTGRWPANVILDESAGEALDVQSDATPSRFFYTAKASKAEREAGLEGMETKLKQIYSDMGQGALPQQTPSVAQPRANHHPTVKPIALMRYLVRLVTPKNGTVLDPFMGSGSTGCAAMCEGVNFVGIELSEEYLEIARRRIEYWRNKTAGYEASK